MIYIGTISNAGTDVVNNKTTAAPFAIPVWVTALRLQASAATISAAVKHADDATFLPATADMLALGAAAGIVDIPIARDYLNRTAGSIVTLACRKSDAGASTTKVFGIGSPP